MGAAQFNYGGGPTIFSFNPAGFIAEDAGRVHDNLSTSGLRERVKEAADILISFTLPGLRVGGDYTDWKNFYAWAISGGEFVFAPNSDVTVLASPWSGSVYYFKVVLEDTAFKPRRAGFQRYAVDCRLRVVPDTIYTPANSGMVMEAFWGQQPT